MDGSTSGKATSSTQNRQEAKKLPLAERSRGHISPHSTHLPHLQCELICILHPGVGPYRALLPLPTELPTPVCCLVKLHTQTFLKGTFVSRRRRTPDQLLERLAQPRQLVMTEPGEFLQGTFSLRPPNPSLNPLNKLRVSFKPPLPQRTFQQSAPEMFFLRQK